MKTKSLFLFFTVVIFGASVAFADCATNPHGFDCQLQVLEGGDANGHVIPNLDFPKGRKTWSANLFVNGIDVRLDPPIATLVELVGQKPSMRTCGTQVNGKRNMKIITQVTGNKITVILKNFRSSKRLIFKGTIIDQAVEAKARNGLFSTKSAVDLVRCSIFDREKVDHLSCAVFTLSTSGELEALGIIGGLPNGARPPQCSTGILAPVVL